MKTDETMSQRSISVVETSSLEEEKDSWNVDFDKLKIGSYNAPLYGPVHFDAEKLEILTKDTQNYKRVKVEIFTKHVYKVLHYQSNEFVVLILFVTPGMGLSVRIWLRMYLEKWRMIPPNYFDPERRNTEFQPIVLVSHSIPEDIEKLVDMFRRYEVLTEVTYQQVVAIIKRRVIPKELRNLVRYIIPDPQFKLHFVDEMWEKRKEREKLIQKPTDRFLRYSLPPMIGTRVIRVEDRDSLKAGHFLSPKIVDFYFAYYLTEVMDFEESEIFFFVPSDFYAAYREKPLRHLTVAEKVLRVKDLFPVNIFEKEYTVFPLYYNCHWLLTILCFDRSDSTNDAEDTSTNNSQGTHRDRNTLKPCLLYFDSRETSVRFSFPEDHDVMTEFLMGEWQRQMNCPATFDEVEGIKISVTQINDNITEAAIYIIHLLEHFRRNPISLPFEELSNWYPFHLELSLLKRERIGQILDEKSRNISQFL